MHPALRVFRFAFGAMIAGDTVDTSAATESRPPIFAPRTEPKPAPVTTAPGSLLSERVRTLVATASTQLLADVKPFDAPSAPAADVELTLVPSGETVQMPRYIVRSTVLSRAVVEPLDVPPLRSTPMDRDDRRMIGGLTVNLLRVLDGQGELNLNILQGSGGGIDHTREFTRVELEFKFRW